MRYKPIVTGFVGGAYILDKTYNDTINSENVKEKSKKLSDQNKQGKVSYMPKLKKYLTVVNEETGEVEGHFPLKSRNLGKGWVALYQDAVSMIADWNLPNEQYRVFLKLLGKLDFDNYLRISQKNISEELGIKQPHVSRAIKALEKREIIVEGPRAGLNKTYRLNPYVAHKGSRNYHDNLIEFNEVVDSKRKPKKEEYEWTEEN